MRLHTADSIKMFISLWDILMNRIAFHNSLFQFRKQQSLFKNGLFLDADKVKNKSIFHCCLPRLFEPP